MTIERLIPPWLASLVPYQPGKPIEEVEREYGIRDSVKLASNENAAGPSPRAVEALRKAAAEVHRYPDGGAHRLRHGIARKLGVAPGKILVGNGSNEVLELLARAFLRPGDEAVFSDQAFVVYRSVVQATGATPVAVPLRDFTHDLEAMADAVGEKTRIVFLGNPNNPTGTIFRRGTFERFLGRMPRDVAVVADEAYAEYVTDPEYPDSLRYHDVHPLLATVRTFSKIHGLAGLRVGFAVTDAELVSIVHRFREPFNVNVLAQAGALAALNDDAHVERSRRLNREGRIALETGFRRLGLDFVPSEANFVLLRVGDGGAVTEALLRRGVIVRPMGAYGFPEYVRVTVGLPEENERFLSALEGVLANRD